MGGKLKNLFKSTLLILLSISSFSSDVVLKNKNITVSGISSGAFFAHQYHMAFNKQVTGSALFAGGPYYCAKGNSNRALKTCMEGESSKDLASESYKKLKSLEKKEKVDALKYNDNDRVYIFTGLNDTVVSQSVSFQLKRLYHLLGLNHHNVKFVADTQAGHTYPTNFFGNKCAEPKKSPFISNCNYDGALHSLRHLYPHQRIQESTREGDLIAIDQRKYFKFGKMALMQDTGYLYIPHNCRVSKTCSLHVAFHGCSQTVDHIDELFVKKTGIMEAADKLNIVVLFPQAKKATLGGINPYGCWDWWGYTGAEYHTKKAEQMRIVKKMIEGLF
jgi:poly(3-hydroxybutyrate) depolymerase